MPHTPHNLAEEFPEAVDLISKLKESDSRFARLFDDYHEINRQIHRSETNVEPTDELHEGEMRRQRLALKDEIAKILSENA